MLVIRSLKSGNKGVAAVAPLVHGVACRFSALFMHLSIWKKNMRIDDYKIKMLRGNEALKHPWYAGPPANENVDETVDQFLDWYAERTRKQQKKIYRVR
jgi:hypothetical protein